MSNISYYKLINFLLLILLIVFAVNTFHSIVRISQREEIIVRTEEELHQVEDYNEQLKRKQALVESQDFIEKEARNKLNLGKEREVVLILPSISPLITPTPPDTSPNWQKWVKLFM